ncbi:MAG: hypothetical protein ABIJ36_01845 [Patescibacteria group bacterium]
MRFSFGKRPIEVISMYQTVLKCPKCPVCLQGTSVGENLRELFCPLCAARFFYSEGSIYEIAPYQQLPVYALGAGPNAVM